MAAATVTGTMATTLNATEGQSSSESVERPVIQIIHFLFYFLYIRWSELCYDIIQCQNVVFVADNKKDGDSATDGQFLASVC